jgi:hypothetical protein
MRFDDLPIWMRKRTPRETVESRKPTKVPAIALLLLFGILTALSAYVVIEYPSGFHLTVIAASATLFVLVILSRVQCTRNITLAFVTAAVAVNLMMIYIAGIIESDGSVAGAVAIVILFTGLTGLLLFSRTRTKPSRTVKVAVLGTVVAMCVTGLLLYLSAPEDGVLGYVTEWFLLASIPMTFLVVMTILVLMAYHRTEQTLPSDKWV